jgi:hypothetical protein
MLKTKRLKKLRLPTHTPKRSKTIPMYHLGGNYLTDENIIRVRIQGHKTIYNLANSIIHEYTHYLQPRKGNWYYRWNNSMGYKNNPYEVEANHIASVYDVQCTHAVLETMFPRRMGRFNRGGMGSK